MEELPTKIEQASLYAEEQMIHDYANMSNESLDEKAQRFIAMLNDPTTLPKHRAIAARCIDHIVAETTYRELYRGE